MNVWNDLKHLRAHEHGECNDPWSELWSDEEITSTSVNHLGMPWTESQRSGGISEDPGAVWLVLGALDHELPRQYLVPRHHQFFAFKQAKAHGLCHGRFRLKRWAHWQRFRFRRRECHLHGGQLQLCRNQGHWQGTELHRGSPREVSRDTQTSASEQAFNVVSGTATRAHLPRGIAVLLFNRARLVYWLWRYPDMSVCALSEGSVRTCIPYSTTSTSQLFTAQSLARLYTDQCTNDRLWSWEWHHMWLNNIERETSVFACIHSCNHRTILVTLWWPTFPCVLSVCSGWALSFVTTFVKIQATSWARGWCSFTRQPSTGNAAFRDGGKAKKSKAHTTHESHRRSDLLCVTRGFEEQKFSQWCWRKMEGHFGKRCGHVWARRSFVTRVRVTANEFNDARKYGPHAALLFFCETWGARQTRSNQDAWALKAWFLWFPLLGWQTCVSLLVMGALEGLSWVRRAGPHGPEAGSASFCACRACTQWSRTRLQKWRFIIVLPRLARRGMTYQCWQVVTELRCPSSHTQCHTKAPTWSGELSRCAGIWNV